MKTLNQGLLVKTLNELIDQNKIIIEKLHKLEMDLAVHKVKSGIFGAVAGAIVALVGSIFNGRA